jgi:ATP-dependent DNA ligase
MPYFYSPMLIHNIKDLSDEEQQKIWNSPEWWAEIKQNGLRVVGYFSNPNHFRTRSVSVETFLPGDVTKGLFWLDVNVASVTDSVVDGEIISTKKKIDTRPYVSGGKGTITGNQLQAAVALLAIDKTKEAQEGNGMPLRYILYDIMKFQGKDVRKLPYLARRDLLRAFYTEAAPVVGHGWMLLNDTTNVDKWEFYQKLVQQGQEGVVLKYEKGLYQEGPTRSREQLKVKKESELDAAITGYSPPRKGSTFETQGLIGGLVFSVKDQSDGRWYEIGSVSNIPMDLRQKASLQGPDGHLIGLNPEFMWQVWEVQGMEWNANAKLSHLRMIRPRTGVDAKNLEDVTFDRQKIVESVS